MKYGIFLSLMVIPSIALNSGLTKPLYHGLAVCDAQKEQWDSACSRMMDLLAQEYDDPQILYDAGVAAYRTGQYEQAKAYFEDSCSCDTISPELKERAYFNKGNACVEQKKLEDALTAYEDALALNPESKAAQHNRDKVKQMLEQQKQQDKQDNNDQKENDQNQQSDDEQQNKDKDSEQQKKDKSGEANNKENNNESKESEKNDESDQSDQGDNQSDNQPSDQKDRSDERKNNKQSEKKDNTGNSADSQESAGDRQKNDTLSEEGDDRDSSSDTQAQGKENSKNAPKEDPQRNQPDAQKGKEEKDATSGTLNEENNERAIAAAQEKNDDLFDKQQAWMARLLQEQENADKEMNKKMVKATVAGSMVNNDGNNSW